MTISSIQYLSDTIGEPIGRNSDRFTLRPPPLQKKFRRNPCFMPFIELFDAVVRGPVAVLAGGHHQQLAHDPHRRVPASGLLHRPQIDPSAVFYNQHFDRFQRPSVKVNTAGHNNRVFAPFIRSHGASVSRSSVPHRRKSPPSLGILGQIKRVLHAVKNASFGVTPRGHDNPFGLVIDLGGRSRAMTPNGLWHFDAQTPSLIIGVVHLDIPTKRLLDDDMGTWFRQQGEKILNDPAAMYRFNDVVAVVSKWFKWRPINDLK